MPPPYAWTFTEVEPADILDALRTTKGGGTLRSWLHAWDWVPAATYLEWAEAGGDTDAGHDIRLAYAKRAVCRRIDGLLWNNYLGKFDRRPYPAKIELLRRVNVPVREVIRQWVIDPRNEIEHGYRATDRQRARDALDIAHLFIDATAQHEEYRPPILVGSWISIQHGEGTLKHLPDQDAKRLTEMQVSEHPFVLYDLDEDPPRLKVVHPVTLEVRWASVSKFGEGELVALALDMQGRNSQSFVCTSDIAFWPAGGSNPLRDFKGRLGL